MSVDTDLITAKTLCLKCEEPLGDAFVLLCTLGGSMKPLGPWHVWCTPP